MTTIQNFLSRHEKKINFFSFLVEIIIANVVLYNFCATYAWWWGVIIGALFIPMRQKAKTYDVYHLFSFLSFMPRVNSQGDIVNIFGISCGVSKYNIFSLVGVSAGVAQNIICLIGVSCGKSNSEIAATLGIAAGYANKNIYTIAGLSVGKAKFNIETDFGLVIGSAHSVSVNNFGFAIGGNNLKKSSIFDRLF